MRFKIAVSWLIITLIFISGVTAAFAEVPYPGYTYDQWGRAIPAPNGYLPETQLTGGQMGCGNFKKPLDMFVDKVNNELYIADSGNNRIVIVDSNFKTVSILDTFTSEKGEEKLNNPSGVYASGDGTIYIVDKGNARVLVATRDGHILNSFGRPKSDLISPEVDYQPDKVVADSHGNMYIQAFGFFQGMVCIDKNGNFLNFYGGNHVEVTASVLLQMLWKKILTREQRNKMESFVPIEYSNMYIDKDNFIYATVMSSQNSQDEIKKLNPMGINILRRVTDSNTVIPKNDYGDPGIMLKGFLIDSTFVDINVDGDKFISALDSARGRIFQYDEESNLLFAFGGLGNQLGTFKTPVALENFNGKLLVLDSTKQNITFFKLTSFGQSVRKALTLYNDGKYQESINPWKEVLKRDSNYILGYVGLGKAYFQLEDYPSAMRYYKLGNDKKGYSDAMMEYMSDLTRENFGYILLVILLMIVAIQLIKRRESFSALFRKMKGGYYR